VIISFLDIIGRRIIDIVREIKDESNETSEDRE
jgi:hypothetical protein